MPDDPYTDEEIKEAACELTHEMQKLCNGQPTASVYMAISYTLGSMEMIAKRPNRDGMMRIISNGMDEYISFSRPDLG